MAIQATPGDSENGFRVTNSMKTYIINLERSAVRRNHILSEAEGCGLDYELIKAVDGQALTQRDLEEMCDLEAIRASPDWLTPGMLGCALSHYGVYRKIVEAGEEMAFVLEDDMVLPNDLPDLLDGISREIASNEIVTLYYFSFSPCLLSKKDTVRVTDNYELYFPVDVSQPITTGGYVITKKAAESLLRIILPIRVGPDSWGYFYDNGGFESFRCVYPVPLRFNGAKSDIHSQTGRGRITRFIDEKKIPVVFHLLRGIRNMRVNSRSRIEFVDERSEAAMGTHHV